MQIIGVSSAANQVLTVSVNINGGTLTLQLAVSFDEMAGFWVMSIADQTGTPLISTVPLLTGAWPAANILQPYQYMNIGSAFVINSSGVATPDYPNSTDLGTDFILLWDDNTNFQPGAIGLTFIGPPGPPGPVGPGLGGFYYMGSSGNLVPQPGVTQWTQVAGSSAGSPNMIGSVNILAPVPAIAGMTFLVQLIQPLVGNCFVIWDPFYKGLTQFELDVSGATQACLLFQILPGGTSASLMWVAQNGNPIT